MTEKKVVILMATYNGQKYLKCQLATDALLADTKIMTIRWNGANYG